MTEKNLMIEESLNYIQESEDLLKEEYKNLKTYSSDTLNLDVMGVMLIDLPLNIYTKSVIGINIIDKVSYLQKKLRIIEDNTLQEVNKMVELKNQTQRDAEQRKILLGNEVYNNLTKALQNYQKTRNLIREQTEYYDRLYSSIKIRYRQASQVMLHDQKLKEAIENE